MSAHDFPKALLVHSSAIAGAVLLVVLLVVLASIRWAQWGDVTADSGREAYVPWVLSKGRTLYRDVWYLYGPLAPYLNSLLFRWLGASLVVLYCAGLAALLIQALALYICGLLLSAPLAGFIAAALVLLQSLHNSLFCYPFAYSFAAVYASVFVALFCIAAIRALQQPDRRAMHWAGGLAALALITKLEHGAACYGALSVLMIFRYWKTRRLVCGARDIATALPGIILCGLVAKWMVSLRGVDFITQENLMSWPSSYFMQHYGRAWLNFTGLSISPLIVGYGLGHAVLFLFFWVAVGRTVSFGAVREPAQSFRSSAVLLVALLANFASAGFSLRGLIKELFLPKEMPVILSLVVVVLLVRVVRRGADTGELALAIVGVTAALVALRISFKMQLYDYPIFYDGPAILIFCIGITRTWNAEGGLRLRHLRKILACTSLLPLYVQALEQPSKAANKVRYESPAGPVSVDRSQLPSYRAAVDLMRSMAAQGQTVMSMPEDTTLYFLAKVECPTRVFTFTPGLLAPGHMTDEFLTEMKQASVQYLLISTRSFPEYKAPEFGVDFNRELGSYIQTHYHTVRRLAAEDPSTKSAAWQVFLWERNSQGTADARERLTGRP